MEAAATRAQQTVEWLESHCFMPEAELDAWAHVVQFLHPQLWLCKQALLLYSGFEGLSCKTEPGLWGQVHWAADDEEGHPVLVVHLAAGMQQVWPLLHARSLKEHSNVLLDCSALRGR